MTPAEESMFRFQLSVIMAGVMRKEKVSGAVARLIDDVNKMLAARTN